MNNFVFSTWLNSTGGPLIVMEEARANLWSGTSGMPSGALSDYDIACKTADYAASLSVHGTDVLVLGDEPLQTMVATTADIRLIVRWKWADSDADVRSAIERFDFNAATPIERMNIRWSDTPLVMFDAADVFNAAECLRFSAWIGMNTVTTFIHEPTVSTSLLIHAIAPT
ncbi:Imm21 family immunity protein [Paraburkholderia caribensis]|uniref:Imm21 family immunity protein n=1 Tax=Paraburkholderia caribensis TaxID=75105 RepID=UPI0007C72EF8|nr:Imm21 family immunity protein [Paraburkholderia caribensis]